MTTAYDNNYAAIKESYTDLADRLDKTEGVDWARVDDGVLKVSVGGIFMPMHTDDAKAEEKELDKVVKLHKENATVVIGVGLGRALNYILGKIEKGHHVIVVEPVLHILKLALERNDWSGHIKDKSLFFATKNEEIEFIISVIESAKVIEDWGVLVDQVSRNRTEYVKVAEYVMKLLNQIQCNTGTVCSAGGKIADNDVVSLPYIVRHRGVKDLEGLFKGKPAVVVATGPSLERNIHIIKEYKDNVVIIAVAQALRPLLAYDIRPDFICTVDFGEVNMTHLAGLLDETVPLVTINKAYAPLIRAYKGPKFVSAGSPGDPEGKCVQNLLADCGELPQGGSVSHMALGLAWHLGCTPVMLAGLDLALGEKSHTSLADSGGKVEVVDGMIRWEIDDPRSKTLHGRKDVGMGAAQYVEGWWGEPVLTNAGLITFITAFENMFKQNAGVVYDCTEGGCRKRGTKRMFLRDVLEKFASMPIDKTLVEPLLTIRPDADERVAKAVEMMGRDVRVCDIIIKHAELALATVMKLRNTKSPKKMAKLFTENAKYSITAQEGAKQLPVVALAIYATSRAIQSRGLNVEADPKKLIGADMRKELKIRLDRNELILKAARDAATDLKKSYMEASTILQKYKDGDRSVLEPCGETTLPDLSDADHYINSGNFAKPMLEALRVVYKENGGEISYSDKRGVRAIQILKQSENIRNDKTFDAAQQQANDYTKKRNLVPQYLDLIDLSLRQGRDDSNIPIALETLREAIALMPEREDGRWGLATALHHVGRHEDAIATYDELIKDFPDKPRYMFERGEVLLSMERWMEAFKDIMDAMERTSEFDAFDLQLARIFKHLGNDEEAKKSYKRYLKRFPHDDDAKAESML